MLPPTGVPAEFDRTLEIGTASLADGKRRIFIFNYGDTQKEYTVSLYPNESAYDFWTGDALETQGGVYTLTLAAHSAKVIETEPFGAR